MKKVNGVFIGSTEEFARRGREIFYKINPELKKEHKGEVLVIEIDSGDYFVNKNSHEAMRRQKPSILTKFSTAVELAMPLIENFDGVRIDDLRLF